MPKSENFEKNIQKLLISLLNIVKWSKFSAQKQIGEIMYKKIIFFMHFVLFISLKYKFYSDFAITLLRNARSCEPLALKDKE